MSLRFRLVLIPLLLVTVALGAIETITYVKIRQTLISNVDGQMQGSIDVMEQWFVYRAAPDFVRPPSFRSVQPFTYSALYETTGQLLGFVANCDPSQAGCKDQPAVSTTLVKRAAAQPAGRTEIYDLGATTHSDGGYRVLATVVRLHVGGPGSPSQSFVLFIAFPLGSVNATTSQVLGLEVVVGLFMLAGIAAVSWFLVKLGLRPLQAMATTASEIAAGDLTKRVAGTDTRTEVGQLGAALNVMLSRIERAFVEKGESEEQLRRFIADASHELRTPLTSIRGYAELFKNGVADRPEDLAAALRRIESESVRMGGLVEDLLLLARLDQGRPLSHDAVDVTQLAADAVQDAGVVDLSRDIRLVAGQQRCEVIGDEQRLRQVMANLLSNAIKYSTPGGPVEVVVTCEGPPLPGSVPAGGVPATALGDGVARPLGPDDFAARPRQAGYGAGGSAPGLEGGRVTVAVVDHGPGIPAEERFLVFDRFWRADPSRKRTSGGNGLGLSIVAAVVAAHGGRVTLHATPGGGATFLVELPVRPATPAPAAPSEPAAML